MSSTSQQRDTHAVEAELDGLLFAISHDLRAPVRAIQGFTQALHEQLQADGIVLSDDASHFALRLDQATRRLQQMLDGLLQLARLSRQPLRIETVNLHTLCQQLIDADPTAGTITLRNEVPPDLNIPSDAELLRIAIAALLKNARQFVSQNVEAQILISLEQSKEELTLCIADNGPGFDMRYAARLGTPFQTLHGATSGLGLGLATAKRIAIRLGGELNLYGELGRGCRALLKLRIDR